MASCYIKLEVIVRHGSYSFLWFQSQQSSASLCFKYLIPCSSTVLRDYRIFKRQKQGLSGKYSSLSGHRWGYTQCSPQTSALLQSHANVFWIVVTLMLLTIYFHCHTHHVGLESSKIIIQMKSFINKVILSHKKSYRKHLCVHVCEHGWYIHTCVGTVSTIHFPVCVLICYRKETEEFETWS